MEKTLLGYQFEQFHFHWGENDTVGSEDLIDNHAYPAELHVVLRNLEYPDFASALDKDHGIAVLAFFFKVRASSVIFRYYFLTKLHFKIVRLITVPLEATRPSRSCSPRSTGRASR